MKSTCVSARTPRQLFESLLHQLNQYALTATAAGVASLALAQPADAKIVYTPAHIKIPRPPRFIGVSVPLDINHDGIDDFNINNFLGGSAPNSYAFMAVAPTRSGAETARSGKTAQPLPCPLVRGSSSVTVVTRAMAWRDGEPLRGTQRPSPANGRTEARA